MTSLCFKYLTLGEIDRNYIKTIEYNRDNKEKYGEVHTPLWFIDLLFERFNNDKWKNPKNKWLDTGAGQGRISLYVYYRLMNGLINIFPDRQKRHNHIIKNMLYMIEINHENIKIIKTIFGNDVNVILEDYLDKNIKIIQPDIIIGNPPFNANGIKKVPTNTEKEKQYDGITLWCSFIKRSLEILPVNGELVYIVPIIWMKPDKAGIYDLLTNYNKIISIRSFTNTETNKIFNKEAQTPTCIIYLQKCNNNVEFLKQDIDLYDKVNKDYVCYSLLHGNPIPVNGASILYKISLKMIMYNVPSMKSIVYKSNMPSIHTKIYDTTDTIKSDINYPNIHSCILDENTASLKVMYSNKPCPYYGIEKLVLAHKMYGFPFYDDDGYFGISNRDNYVIIIDEIKDMSKIERREIYEKYKHFLTLKLAIFLFSTTTYRMKYLEKYIFELLPQIHLINDFPSNITNKSVCNFFELNEIEENYVNNFIKKKYVGF